MKAYTAPDSITIIAAEDSELASLNREIALLTRQIL